MVKTPGFRCGGGGRGAGTGSIPGWGTKSTGEMWYEEGSSRCSSKAAAQATCASQVSREQAKLGCPHPPLFSMLPNRFRKILVHFVKTNTTNVIMNGNQHWRPQTSGVGTHKEGPGTAYGGWELGWLGSSSPSIDCHCGQSMLFLKRSHKFGFFFKV